MISNAHSVVPFEEAVTDCTGGQHKVQRRDYLPVGDVPVLDQGQEFISGFAERGVAYTGSFPVVLFGDHTRVFKFVDFPFAIGADGVKVLVPREGFDPRFLYYYFRSVRLPNAGYSRHFKFLREIVVPKPSLATQRRIVDLLSRAEGIVRLRREAQAKAQAIIPALFLDTFGDPATNPKGWPIVPLGELLRAADYGSSTKASDTGAGLPLIRMGNVTYAGDLNLASLKYVELEPDEVARYSLEKGDILFNRTNSKELVGKTGLWDGSMKAVAASYFIRLRVEPQRVIPFYLWAFMNTCHMKRVLFDTARGAIGQANINSKELRAFLVPVPPLDVQAHFEEHSCAVQSIAAQQAEARKKAEATFQALLASEFRGMR